MPVEDEEDPDELDKRLRPQFQKHIYPDSVIFLRGEDEFIRKRAKALTPEENLKWDVENLERRLLEFNKNNSIGLFFSANTAGDLGRPDQKPMTFPTTRFFQENKTEVFEVDAEGNQFEMFESMRVYIERDGRSYNYLSSVNTLNKKREKHLTQEEADSVAAANSKQEDTK